MNLINESQADQPLAQFIRYLLLQAEISSADFCAATEPGKIVITKSSETENKVTKDDMIFQATDFILKYADKDTLQNVLYTIESTCAERWAE